MKRLTGIAAFVMIGLGGAAAPARGADFVWPVSGHMTSTYYSPRPYGYHHAIDIAGPYGSAVGASRAGYVAFRGWSGGYGRLVIVSHGSGYRTYYGHNQSFGHGGRVGRLTTIAYRGSSGHSTGPHVHFEIRRYGSKLYIPGYRGKSVYKGSGVPHNYPGIS